jgi:hypothetical protein
MKCSVEIDSDSFIKKLRGPSPRANYTDRTTAAWPAKLAPTFADRGCHVVSVTDPYGRILGFLERDGFIYVPNFVNIGSGI